MSRVAFERRLDMSDNIFSEGELVEAEEEDSSDDELAEAEEEDSSEDELVEDEDAEALDISENTTENLFDSKAFPPKYLNQIIENKDKVLSWAKNSKLGPIQRGVLTELSVRQLTPGSKLSLTASQYESNINKATNPGLKFHPLYAAQVYNQFINSGVEFFPFVPFELRQYTAFVGTWMDDLDANKNPWVPKQPVLLFSFLMAEENFSVLVDEFENISQGLRFHYEELTEKQYIAPKKGLQTTPFKKAEALKKLGHDITQMEVDKTQGLKLSNSGNTLLTLYLGLVIEMARNDGPLSKALKLDASSFETMFTQAYVYVCKKQEEKLKSYNTEKIPYTFSDYGLKSSGKKVLFPRLLPHVPQTLANLNIRSNPDAPMECSACQKGYNTYYGYYPTTWQNKPRQKVKWNEDETKVVSGGNDTGLCVQELDDLLREAGFDPNAQTNNPWYIDFVGTWQQAQRRLDAFKEKQQELYDLGDPRYSWVDYYYKWLILKVDLVIKKLANISDVDSTAEPPIEPDLDDEKGSTWGEWILNGVKGLFKFLKYATKFSAVLIYKIISLILVSPATQELLIRGCNYLREQVCRSLAIEQGKAVLARTSDDKTNEDGTPVIETFNHDTGEWFAATKAQQKEWTEKGQQSLSDWWDKNAFSFFNVLSNAGIGGTAWKDYMDGATLYYGKSIDILVEGLKSIPLIGGLVSKLGGVETLKPLIIGTIYTQGKNAWTDMVLANKKLTQLKRLYQAMFSGASDCLTNGQLVIKDGDVLGSTSYYKEAFLHAQFNIPYYAIIIINQLAVEEEEGRSPDINVIIETLLRTEVVSGSAARKQLEEQARKDVDNMQEWYNDQMENPDGTYNFGKSLVKQRNIAEENRQLLEKNWKRKKQMLATAAAFALIVGAAVATGGAVGAGSAIASAASTGAAAVSSTASATIASVPSAVAAVKSAATLGSVASLGKKALKGVGTVADYGLKVTSLVAKYPDQALLAGGLAMSAATKLKLTIDHWGDATKALEVHKVLKEASVRGMLFHSQLRQKIDMFRSEENQELSLHCQNLMQRKAGMVVAWAKKPAINEKATLDFFGKYGSPHAQIPVDTGSGGVMPPTTGTSKWLPKNSSGVQRKRRTLFVS